jgi:hypothetical protein
MIGFCAAVERHISEIYDKSLWLNVPVEMDTAPEGELPQVAIFGPKLAIEGRTQSSVLFLHKLLFFGATILRAVLARFSLLFARCFCFQIIIS